MKPDYSRSIVNLMASLAAACGVEDTGYLPLEELPLEQLAGRPLALLIIDGLGESILQQFPDSHLARAHRATLTSVMPSTTASAITSLATGVAPQQHAITGWHMWLRETGSVAAILPFMPRHGRDHYSRSGWDPRQFIGVRPLSEQLQVPMALLTPRWLMDTDYSRALAGPATRHGHEDMDDFFVHLHRLLSKKKPCYLYAYWPDLDAIAHRHGCRSRELAEHFMKLDRAFAALCTALRGSGALLLVSADHGFIDTDEVHTLQLDDHPVLAGTLAIPLCGESRAVYCYLRHGHEDIFLDYVRHELAGQCEAVASMELLSQGWFGLGQAHPRLQERIGDYILLMKEKYVLRDRLANEKPFHLTGVHGGISRDEMQVPLLYADL